MKASTPQTYLFRYATTIKFAVGDIEFVIVAKSARELQTIWSSMAPPDAAFNIRLVDEVRIIKRES